MPETALRLDEMHGYGPLAARFDEVVSWNEAISPYHPSAWGPRGSDTVLWQRALRLLWDIGEDERVDLAVESIQANPARALVAIFSEASVDVYADGLMSYGPTREKLPLTLGRRVRRLLHLDLLPGLRPLLLSEYGVEPVVVPDGAFRAVLDEVAREAADDPLLAPVREERPTAVLLGQYLAAINILSADEEEDLHVRMLAGAVRAGHRSLVFKPHPTAPAGYAATLHKAAADAGVRLTVPAAPLLAETLYEHARPELVVGCFSTAMVTASAYYGVPVARVGTALVLDRLRPYQNSNRIPLALVDHLVPDLERDETPAVLGAAPASLGALVRAMGFCMQPRTYPALRGRRRSGCGGISRAAPPGTFRPCGWPSWGCRAAARRPGRGCGLRGPGGRWEGWCGGAGGGRHDAGRGPVGASRAVLRAHSRGRPAAHPGARGTARTAASDA